jgi:hypothetical protein
VPFLVMLDALSHLRKVESARVVEAEEQFVGIVDVGGFFLEVILEVVDGFALEGFVEGSREDAADVSAVELLIDVGR